MQVRQSQSVYATMYITDLRHSIRGRVHELSEVHHAFPLVLRDVDGLDRGETWICISEVLQL